MKTTNMSMDVNLCKPCAFLFRVTAMMHLFFRRNHIPCLGKKLSVISLPARCHFIYKESKY